MNLKTMFYNVERDFDQEVRYIAKIWFVIMLVFIPVWYLNCKIEEKQMTELHKEKYLNYKKTSGMFFPRMFGG